MQATHPHRISPGSPVPFGAQRINDGVNFSLFSSVAKQVELQLYAGKFQQFYLLDPKIHKTGDVWHLFVHNLPEEFLYCYRIDGNLAFDPYAKELNSPSQWGQGMHQPLLGIMRKDSPFDWQGTISPRLPPQDLIIYEMHPRSFTLHPSSHVKHPGTLLGIIEKIPYLKSLGINAIELMPLMEFNEREIPGKLNVWGYSSISFFSLMRRYGYRDIRFELKMLTRELHIAGIELFLDVVYNHTGKDCCLKIIDPATYYLRHDYTGCGNTLNANHPVASQLIIDSLRYFVSEYHIDGFRFDLASALTRGEDGAPLPHPPLIETIAKDPILSHCKLIAEPWDAGGLYQVGSFPGAPRFSEWNGKYRDTVRRFLRSAPHQTGAFATALCGSEDLYHSYGSPTASINFITSHDGFSLNDLVSYQKKHNLENGENNQDGTNDNESDNCGIEGATSNEKILQLREQQMRNFHLALFLSAGIPMLFMGDEYGHTKSGNNNPWCQDNERNWFLWDELEKKPNLFRFVQQLIHLRSNEPYLRKKRFYTPKEIDWHGKSPSHPDWGKDSHLVAFTLKDEKQHPLFYVAFNASSHSVHLHLPPAIQWQRLIDTHLKSPHDFSDIAPAVENPNYSLAPHAAILLKVIE